MKHPEGAARQLAALVPPPPPQVFLFLQPKADVAGGSRWGFEPLRQETHLEAGRGLTQGLTQGVAREGLSPLHDLERHLTVPGQRGSLPAVAVWVEVVSFLPHLQRSLGFSVCQKAQVPGTLQM